MELYLCNMWHVCRIMYNLGCVLVESRPFVVLNGLPGLYGLKYDSATAYGLLLYLCSYKLDSSATLFDTLLVLSWHVLVQLKNHQNSWNFVSYEPYFYVWCSFGWILYKCWRLKVWVKDRQQLPHTKPFARPRVKLRTKMGHLLDMTSTYKLFQASPVLVNFGVSTILSWVIE